MANVGTPSSFAESAAQPKRDPARYTKKGTRRQRRRVKSHQGEPLRTLSWGMGTQSTALGVLSALGEFGLPKLDHILAADLGWERQATYRIVEWYKPWFEEHGIPVHIIKTADMRIDAVSEHVHIPFYTKDGGPLKRQCTQGFKIRPLARYTRELLGYPASNPPHPPPDSCETWLGISLDEYHRMRKSQQDWMIHRYPLVELRLTRTDCIDYLREKGFPVPVKSACVCCPYRTNIEWQAMKEQEPDEFQEAAEFDDANRFNPLACNNSNAQSLYLHRDLAPLRDIDFASKKSIDKSTFQVPLFVPCEGGYCNV